MALWNRFCGFGCGDLQQGRSRCFHDCCPRLRSVRGLTKALERIQRRCDRVYFSGIIARHPVSYGA